MVEIVLSKSAGRLGITASDSPHGVIVTELCEESVAAAMGLNVGDLIVAVNGVLVSDHCRCIEEIDGANDRVALAVAAPGTRSIIVDKNAGRIGVTCTNSADGVLVSMLEDGSIASDAGLCVGDHLLSVNGRLTATAQEAIDRIDAAPDMVQLVVRASTRRVTLRKRAGSTPVGITVADRVDGGACGIVVVGLEAGGLAIRQLVLGDVILSIDGERLALPHAHTHTHTHKPSVCFCDCLVPPPSFSPCIWSPPCLAVSAHNRGADGLTRGRDCAHRCSHRRRPSASAWRARSGPTFHPQLSQRRPAVHGSLHCEWQGHQGALRPIPKAAGSTAAAL
jgi:S1-C subfamily serine protease